MLESVSLQKNRLRSAKNVIFSLLCILVDRPMGGVWTPKTPPLRTPLACVLGPWPWPRAILSLASRVSVLGKAVLGLGLGFFLCPWPWPRALCPRLHLWCVVFTVCFCLISASRGQLTRRPYGHFCCLLVWFLCFHSFHPFCACLVLFKMCWGVSDKHWTISNKSWLIERLKKKKVLSWFLSKFQFYASLIFPWKVQASNWEHNILTEVLNQVP